MAEVLKKGNPPAEDCRRTAQTRVAAAVYDDGAGNDGNRPATIVKAAATNLVGAAGIEPATPAV